MKLYGHEVKQEWIDAALCAMEVSFSFRNVEDAALRAGCPARVVPVYGVREEWFAGRVADRLLAKEKKAGRIRFNKKTRLWEKVKA